MNNHLIPGSATIVEAFDALNRLQGAPMTLFVTDADGRLAGSLTDGDIRRALLAGGSLSSTVESICRKDCLRVSRTSPDMEIISAARKRGITLLPMVEDGFVVALVDLSRQRGLIAADAVLMAGGAGERLRPLTLQKPKPLLPVGNRPIIDHNIALLRSFGVENIYVTVNYLKEQIITHFQKLDPRVRCVEEPRKLGTIGSLSLIDDFRSPHVLVMNSDLFTDINLENMYLRHIDTEAALTMAVVPYTVSIPYAIVRHAGDRVEGLEEKPTYNYYANAGIYILRREVALSIPKYTRMDATELIDKLIADGQKVSYYPIEGRWLDIGSHDDYRYANSIAN